MRVDNRWLNAERRKRHARESEGKRMIGNELTVPRQPRRRRKRSTKIHGDTHMLGVKVSEEMWLALVDFGEIVGKSASAVARDAIHDYLFGSKCCQYDE